MESAVLYKLAEFYNIEALTLLTVSDSVVSEEQDLTNEQKEQGLNTMIKLALDLV